MKVWRVRAVCWTVFAAGLLVAIHAVAAPTVPNEILMPGTQPGDMVNPYTSPNLGGGNCSQCHSGTENPDLEPYFGWQGSMMSHASRDPLFWATLAVAEQTFVYDANVSARGGAGDLCLRCT